MRLLRISAGLVAGLVIFVALAALVAPDTTVRLLAGRAAAWSGIDADGLDTLDVSLSDARISGGPISFGQGPGEWARIGRLLADLDGAKLVTGRLVVEDLALADADLKLTFAPDDRPRLNGIPLAPPAGEAQEQRTADTDAAARPRVPDIAVHKASLDGVRVEISTGAGRALPVAIDHLHLENLSPEAPDTPATFGLAGRAGEARFDVNGEAKVFGDPIDVVLDGGFEGVSLAEVEAVAGPLGLSRREGRLSSSGRHHLTLAAPGRVELASTGALTAAGVDVAVPGSVAVRLDSGTFTLDGGVTTAPEGGVEIRNRAPLDMAGLAVAWSEKGSVRLAAGRVEADIAATLAPGGTLAAKLAGPVPVTGLVVAWSETGAVFLDSGTARVDLDVTRQPDGAMRIAGPMAIDGGSGGIRSGGSFQLSYQGIDARYPDARIELAADGTAIVDGKPGATLTGFALAEPTPVQAERAVVTAERLHLRSPEEGVLVEYEGGLDLHQASVPLDEAARLRMAELGFRLSGFRYDEEPNLAAIVRGDIAGRATGIRKEGEQKKKGSVPFPVVEGTLTLAGLDLMLTPSGGIRRLALGPQTEVVLAGVARGRPHHLSLGLERFEIADLDSDVPDQLTRADIVAVVNDRGRIELKENVKPFATPPEFVFTGSIRALELPDLSPYVAAAAGLDVESGRLAATGRVTAAGGKLDGIVEVDIQTLALKPAAKEGYDPAADLTGVPVDIAVALLEDANRRIDVSLPISGDLSSPEVDYCDVIRTALLGAVRLVVTAPFQGSGKKGTATGFGPVPFPPGGAAIGADAAGQLERMAKLLAEKPRLRLQVCGRATGADAKAMAAAPGSAPGSGEAVSARLLALAQERGRVVADSLATSAGVQPTQVQECRPTADARDPGAPRVEARF